MTTSRSGLSPAQRARIDSALRSLPIIDDWAVIERGEAVCVYVTGTARASGAALLARLAKRLSPDDLPDAIVPVTALPFDAQGALDTAALTEIAWVDEGVVARLQSAIDAHPSGPGLVRLDDTEDPLPWLHRFDLVPGAQVAAASTAERGVPAPTAAATAPMGRQLAISDGGPITLAPDAPTTMIEALLRAAGRGPNVGVRLIDYGSPDSFLSYEALLHRAQRVLGGLRARGLQPGDKVLLHSDALGEHFVAFWACALGGFLASNVSAAPGYTEDNGVLRKLQSTWEFLGRPPVICSARLEAPVRGLEALMQMQGIRVWSFDQLVDHEPDLAPHPCEPTDLLYLQLTSGSTGTPKCVQETHRGVIYDLTTYGVSRRSTADDVTLNWFPMDHVLPFMYHHVSSVFFGCNQVHVATPSILTAPLRWLDLIERYQATHTWSPNFGLKLVNDALRAVPERTWGLHSLRCWLTAGEQVTLPVVRQLMERLAPMGITPDVLQPAYGMTECSLVYQDRFDFETGAHAFDKASLSGVLEEADPGDPGAQTFVHVGWPHQGVTVRIVDAEDRVLPEGIIGHIQARRPVVEPRYYPDKPITPELTDGWFKTGDRGFLVAGHLTITGRDKEMIIVRGHNVFCHEVEEVVGHVPGVENTFVGAVATLDPSTGTEGVCIFFVPATDDKASLPQTIREVKSRVTAELGIAPAYVLPVAPHDFPRTTSGKIQRTRLRKALEAGEFAEAVKRADLLVRNSNTCPDWFYRMAWPAVALRAEVASSRRRLVFARGDLAEAFAEGGDIVVMPGDGFRAVAARRFEISPESDADLDLLLRALVGDGMLATDVVHAWAVGHDGHSDELTALLDAQKLCASSLLRVLHAFDRLGTPSLRLWAVTREAHAVLPGERPDPVQAILCGLVRSAHLGVHWLQGHTIDLAVGTTPAADCDRICAETNQSTAEREVAYRDGQRHAARLARAALASTAPGPLPFEAGSLVVIVGELDHVAVVSVASALLAQADVAVLCLGATHLPPRETGEQGEANGSEADPRRDALRQLEALGEVYYDAVDPSLHHAVEAAVARAEASTGRAMGSAFYADPPGGARPLTEESPDHLEARLTARAGPLLALSAVATRRGAHLVSLSPITSRLGAGINAGHAAVGSFVDAYTTAHRGHSLLWSRWHAERPSLAARSATSGLVPVRAAQAATSLFAAISRDPGTLLIGLDGGHHTLRARVLAPPRATAVVRAYVGASATALGPDQLTVHDAFGTPVPCPLERLADLPVDDGGSVDPSRLEALLALQRGEQRAFAAPKTDVEQRIAAIWRDVLAVDEVSADDNFFDLGGSSILLVSIVARLDADFGRELTSLDMFQHPTVRAMARYLTGAAEAEAEAKLASSADRGASRRQAMRSRRRRPKRR